MLVRFVKRTVYPKLRKLTELTYTPLSFSVCVKLKQTPHTFYSEVFFFFLPSMSTACITLTGGHSLIPSVASTLE